MIGKLLIHNDPFNGGPLYRMERAVGLIKVDDLRIARRVMLVILIGWLIPGLLLAFEGEVYRGDRLGAFVYDFANNARFLITAPIFIIAEAITIPRLASLAHHFLGSGLIADQDRDRFDEAISSTRRLMNSWLVDVLVIILAFAIVFSRYRILQPEMVPAWYKSEGGEQLILSPAGWWSFFVSVPLFIILFLGWMWRVFLWGRFLWLMSRLNLRLIPGHPDRAGGLKFISYSLRSFSPLGFALGALVAGFEANRLIYHGAPTAIIKKMTISLLIFVVILFSGPLFIFTRKLIDEKRRGILAYGSLALGLGQQFERKWISHSGNVEESALEVADFSSTTDLYQIVSNVYSMLSVPIDIRDVIMVIVSTLLPFIPVLFIVLPVEAILQELTKLLF